MALQWMFLLLLTPLLAAQNRGKPYPNHYGKLQGRAKCQKPQWDTRLQFLGKKPEYPQNREVTLTCPEGLEPSFPEVKCTKEIQRVTPGKPVYVDAWWGRSSTGAWTRIEGDVLCMEGCKRPQCDSRLQLAPDQENYKKEEKVMLSCPEGFQPSFTEIQCPTQFQYDDHYGTPVYKEFWLGRDSSGAWVPILSSVDCIEICQRPQWDSRLQLAPDQENYKKEEKVMLSCPEGLQPSFTEIQCPTQFQYDDHYGTPVYKEFWLGRDSSGAWVPILSSVDCIEICQRPQWDSRLQLAPDLVNYKKNEKVMLSCPEGFQPPCTEIQCQTQFQYDNDYGTRLYKEFWRGRDSSGAWVPILSSVDCIEVLQVDPNTFEISRTSIQLKWTCRFPDACQGMRARCRLAVPSSPPCEAEEVNGEQMLHGQEGTFTCSPLQPFTEYNVTIDLPPNTTLFSWFFMTQETGQTVGQWHWIVIGLVVLLADRLVVAVILWLVHSRKRKYLPS
ncbi:uncharacterized protein LOC135290481 isoform X3 [Passer domesticus]|uniref:uncharacterized protein LOC135290481 isoform X3 n=1 Tax=Passer domesticus TaxID=48849 RepID=UPI0030FE1A5C